MPKPGEKSPAPKGEATSPKMTPADSTSEGLVWTPRTFRARFSRLKQDTALKIETAEDLLEFQRVLREAQMWAGIIQGEPPKRGEAVAAAGNSDTSSDPKPAAAAEGVSPPKTPVDDNDVHQYADPVDFGPSNYDAPDDFEEADAAEEEAEEEAEAFDRQPTPRP